VGLAEGERSVLVSEVVRLETRLDALDSWMSRLTSILLVTFVLGFVGGVAGLVDRSLSSSRETNRDGRIDALAAWT